MALPAPLRQHDDLARGLRLRAAGGGRMVVGAWLRWTASAGPLLALALLGWTVLVALVGDDGWLLAVLTAGVMLTVPAARRVTRTHPLLIACLVGTLPLIVVVATRSWPLGEGGSGPSSAMGMVYLLAGAGAVTAAGAAAQRWQRVGLYSLGGAWLLAPFLLGAGAASIGVLALMMSVALPASPSRLRRIVVVGVILTVLGAALSASVGIVYQPQDLGGFERVIDATVGRDRALSWHGAVEQIRAEPVMGVGPEVTRPGTTAVQRGSEAASIHSAFLWMAARTGLIGGLLLMGVVIWALAVMIRDRPGLNATAAVIASTAVAASASVDDAWQSPAVPLAMAGLLGVSLAQPADERIRPPVPLSGDGRRLALASVLFGALIVLPIAPSNAPLTVPNDVQLQQPRPGLEFPGRTGVVTARPPERLYAKLIDSGEFTIELSLTSNAIDRIGPARIVTLSDGIDHRNLTVGQELDALVLRLRTTNTDLNAADPSLEIPGVFDIGERIHVVITSNIQETRVYIDGVLRSRGAGPGGSLENWDPHYPLLFGNETTVDRPWAGELSLVAFYDRTVDQPEVDELYRTRAGASEAPSAVRSASASAVYVFEEDAEAERLRDHSIDRFGGDLVIPARLPSGPTDSVWTVDDVTIPEWFGLLAHVLGGIAWIGVAYRAASRRISPSAARRVLSGLLVLAVAGAATVWAMWPRDDVPDRPDVVVVLGGGGPERAQLGAELRDRYDATLVLSAEAARTGARLGLTCGVDALCVDPQPATTAGEARMVADLAAEHGWNVVLVATSRFHTTRSRLLFRQCLGEAVDVVGTTPPDGRDLGVHTRELVGSLAALTVRRAC